MYDKKIMDDFMYDGIDFEELFGRDVLLEAEEGDNETDGSDKDSDVSEE